jgi:hypothetical protein
MKTKTTKNNGTSPGPGTILCLCIHWLKGRTEIPKTCIMNYHCERCAFDQWLDELDHLDAQFYRAA